jgi:hypothetical protein
MQSPIQYDVPFSGGRKITISSGPHYYRTERWVGSAGQGEGPRSAFEALKRHAIPLQGDQGSAEGDVKQVRGFGPIRQHVDDDHMTVVNTTMPGHLLHPGNVIRSVVQRGDDLYVVTEGYGTGALPSLNEGGRFIWSLPDHEIRHELNPHAMLGYPMDEMNAPSATGVRAPTEGQPSSSAQPADRPEYRLPPPIFLPQY